MDRFDLIIVGAGPSGSAAALYAARRGLSCALLDKAVFPRDKTCGDALSGKTVVLLSELGLYERVRELPGALVNRVVFSAPDSSVLDVDMRGHDLMDPVSGVSRPMEGMVIRREVFDQFLFREAQAAATACHQGFTVRDVITAPGTGRDARRRGAGGPGPEMVSVRGTHADGSEAEFRGRIVLGGDGFSSVVARRAGLFTAGTAHRMVALRQYFRGIPGLTDQIELHFLDQLAPGYLWIFPAGDGLANVGLGLDHCDLQKQRAHLPGLLQEATESPRFRARFADATAVGKAVGWNLPVGSVRRRCVADGVMLMGDAAGLIDPFTGEGIGNAIYSARAAVETAVEALAADNVSTRYLRRYGARVWEGLGPELRTSSRLHRLGRHRSLMSWVIRRAGQSDELRDMICGMMANSRPRAELVRPWFYLKLLLR
jgi:menaquinone-9 beta-reductase